jgi:preprotein translocase subunit SecD
MQRNLRTIGIGVLIALAGITSSCAGQGGEATAPPTLIVPASTPRAITPTPMTLTTSTPHAGLRVVLDVGMGPAPLSDVQAVLLSRLLDLGFSDARIQQDGPNSLIVDLPALADPQPILRLLQQPGHLALVDSAGQDLPIGAVVIVNTGKPSAFGPPATPNPAALGPFTAVITESDILTPTVIAKMDSTRVQAVIELHLTPAGTQRVADFTSAHIGSYLPIVLDNQVVSSPAIASAIPAGALNVSTGSLAESRQMSAMLRSGPLSRAVTLRSTQTIP